MRVCPSRHAFDGQCLFVAYDIDVKNVFYVFYFGHGFLTFLTFFILSTFFICKKRWQNRRVSKRKNSNKIIPFNNIIFFSRVN